MSKVKLEPMAGAAVTPGTAVPCGGQSAADATANPSVKGRHGRLPEAA